MSAILYFPKFGRPEPAPLLPTIPSLTVMVLTLTRDHMHKLTLMERFDLLIASWVVIRGDDADPKTQVRHMRIIYPIFQRVVEGAT